MKLALAVLLFFLVTTLAKHHSHKYSCPVLRKCPTHKHKVCGSDGKLYNSHCNLRKAACESDIPLRAVHPDRCSGDDDTDEYGKVASRAATGPRGPQNSSMSSRDEDECNAQSYDILKEQILLKIKDISLLFTQLDENSDGSININELWKKSGTLKLTSTPCLLTDLLQHEDKNQDEVLDYSEFQDAFANLYTVSMVTLDQNLAVNKIQAHIGDNVEIRCDISGKPQLPVIKWFRYNIDLATVNMVNMKVFSDGSLYLTNVQISFSGNYTCQAESNPAIKQVHILHVIVSPSVDVRPPFQWSVPGGFASIDCQYENLADEAVRVHWLKNDEPLEANSRMTIMNNATRIQIGDLQRSDTGAYSCRVENCRDTAIGQSIASVLVQEDPVGSSPSKDKKKLWVFHGNGVSIFNGGCSGLVHEIDGRDIMPQNGLALCGRTETEEHPCQWAAEGPVMAENRIYAAQPTLNRIIVFHVVQMNVIQVIVTDPRPTRLWLVPSEKENRIWVLCHGEPERTFGASSPTGHAGKKESDIRRKESFGSYEEERSADQFEFEWTSSSSGKNEQQRKNRKTVQIIRISGNLHNQNVIHLQPIDGHFDLVYDLFVP
ncbi:Follistatin-related protein 5 [Halotydeus destructor]|nr:Follistatin-related protein 5 [Halotydeus destructor]